MQEVEVLKQVGGLIGCIFFFFFQAEDGIRDKLVTGVQTCALPIFVEPEFHRTKHLLRLLARVIVSGVRQCRVHQLGGFRRGVRRQHSQVSERTDHARSEEHTSELQSLAYLVCRLLLEKKKKNIYKI